MPRTQLTPNFNISEFDCNDRARTRCPEEYAGQLEKLCKWFLEPLRDKFGTCFVMSGFRTPEHNKDVGGARYSFHVYTKRKPRDGVAVDVIFAKGSPDAWAHEARRLREKNREGQGGVGLYVHEGFIHIDTRDYKADWSG